MLRVVRSIRTNGRRGGLCDPVDMPICATSAGILSLIFSLIRLEVLILTFLGLLWYLRMRILVLEMGLIVYYGQ